MYAAGIQGSISNLHRQPLSQNAASASALSESIICALPAHTTKEVGTSASLHEVDPQLTIWDATSMLPSSSDGDLPVSACAQAKSITSEFKLVLAISWPAGDKVSLLRLLVSMSLAKAMLCWLVLSSVAMVLEAFGETAASVTAPPPEHTLRPPELSWRDTAGAESIARSFLTMPSMSLLKSKDLCKLEPGARAAASLVSYSLRTSKQRLGIAVLVWLLPLLLPCCVRGANLLAERVPSVPAVSPIPLPAESAEVLLDSGVGLTLGLLAWAVALLLIVMAWSDTCLPICEMALQSEQ